MVEKGRLFKTDMAPLSELLKFGWVRKSNFITMYFIFNVSSWVVVLYLVCVKKKKKKTKKNEKNKHKKLLNVYCEGG